MTARRVLSNFTDLDDTPAAITALQFARGNAGGTALEFVDPGLTNYLRRDGSNTITGVITPDADGTRNFGTNSLRFNRMNAESANFVGNEVAPTRGSNGQFSVMGGRNTGAGSNTFQIGGGTFPPCGMFGNVLSYYANQTAVMRHQGGGSFMVGSAFTYYGNNDTAEIISDSSSFGSFTGGYAYPYFGSSGTTIRIRNQTSGSFLWAYPAGNGGTGTLHEVRIYGNAQGAFCVGRTRGAGNAQVHAGGNAGGEAAAGGFVAGYINASNATATGVLRTSGQGAFAQGSVNASVAGQTATIDAQNTGSFAQGTVLNQASIIASGLGAFAQGRASSTGSITASQRGAFAQGNQTGAGSITASGQGSFAHGRCLSGYSITASGLGSFAVGESDTASIVASATNAAQFGPGTNALATSLAVGDISGTGIRIAGGGAPGTPVDGDIWKASGDISFESNGVTVGAFNQPAVTGSRAGNAALASLLTTLANMNIITDSTTA